MAFELLIESWQDGASGLRFARYLVQSGQQMFAVKYLTGNCRSYHRQGTGAW